MIFIYFKYLLFLTYTNLLSIDNFYLFQLLIIYNWR